MTLSKGYRLWLDEAILLMRLGLPVVKTHPVTVRLWIAGGRGWADGRDGDNVIKPVIDAARKAGRIRDDTTPGHVRRIELDYLDPADPKQAAYCLLELVEPTRGK